MQLAETNPEMTFETIQNELQIEKDDVESFIIDGKYFQLLLFISIFVKPQHKFIVNRDFHLEFNIIKHMGNIKMNQYWLKNVIFLFLSYRRIQQYFFQNLICLITPYYLHILVLKTKLVRARMDQANGKVLISSTMHRTFGRPQWLQLRDLLAAWKTNLSSVQEGMTTVASAQLELAVKAKTTMAH